MDDACGSASRVQRPRRIAASTARNLGERIDDLPSYQQSSTSLRHRRRGNGAFRKPRALPSASDAQQMCTGDAMRLCGHEIPNVQRITACMHKQRANVSAGCRAVMDRDNTARRRAAAGE